MQVPGCEMLVMKVKATLVTPDKKVTDTLMFDNLIDAIRVGVSLGMTNINYEEHPTGTITKIVLQDPGQNEMMLILLTDKCRLPGKIVYGYLGGDTWAACAYGEAFAHTVKKMTMTGFKEDITKAISTYKKLDPRAKTERFDPIAI